MKLGVLVATSVNNVDKNNLGRMGNALWLGAHIYPRLYTSEYISVTVGYDYKAADPESKKLAMKLFQTIFLYLYSHILV